MSLEQKVRDSLAAQVGDAPPAPDLAARSLKGARAVRRRRTVGAVAAVAIAAVAVPLALRPSHSQPTTPAGETNTPSSTAGALSVGAPPKSEFVLFHELHRPSASGPPVALPTPVGRAFSTPQGTVVLAAPSSASTHRIYVVRSDGSIDDLVNDKGVVLGMAADSTRVAYSVAVPEGDRWKSDLVLIDIASGRELQRLSGGPSALPIAFGDSDTVVLAVDKGAGEAASWRLDSDTLVTWPKSAGWIPLDAVGNVALIAADHNQCIAVVDIEPANVRFSTCQDVPSASAIDRFGAFAPNGKLFALARYNQDEMPTGNGPLDVREWPVLGDPVTGDRSNGLRPVFRAAELRIDADSNTRLTWEDNNHILVNALDRTGGHLIVRCDVDTANCEIAANYGRSEAGLSITLVRRV